MRLDRIQIHNYRPFVDFDLTLGGDSVTVVAANAGGKTALLVAMSSALSGARGLGRRDFHDLATPIEIVATLKELEPDDQSAFVDAVRFGGAEPTVDLGIRALWDEESQQIDVTWGFPDRAWARAGRTTRERIPLLTLPSYRDPARLLAFTGSRSVLEQLLASVDLDQPLDAAVSAVEAALSDLVTAPETGSLLQLLKEGLSRLIPDVVPEAFQIEPAASTSDELLDQFELALAHAGPQMTIERQSSGLAQLAVFVVALRVAATRSAIVIVDEPETSLHPHAQRSLASAIQRESHQSIIATHSSSVLSRADVRNVVRLKREGGNVEAKRPSTLSANDATKLARYATPETAEAFFARTVIFAEGPSDYLALHAAADVLSVDLDARGAAVVSLQGASLLSIYLTLLGPNGLDLSLCGLCDLDAESEWRAKLQAVGLNATSRAALNSQGFYVCDIDLEDELIRAHGSTAVQSIIALEGEARKFSAFASQLPNRSLTLSEQLTEFVRKSKTRWSPKLVSELSAASMPSPLRDVLANA